MEYTRKRRTFTTDKLAAFSGITRMVHKVLKCTKEDYLAVLWKPSLLEELLWEGFENESRKSQPSLYIAPTWSWASFDSSVGYSVWYYIYHKSPFQIWAKILDARTFPQYDDFSPIKGGFLTTQAQKFFLRHLLNKEIQHLFPLNLDIHNLYT
jgi:hypothetical protein